MLPQSLALKVLLDAPGKVKPGTSRTDPASADQAGFRHGRGESPQGPSPSPAPEKSKRGVTRVFVLSKNGKPLMPCRAARARELLKKGKAVVVRCYPFVIRLKHNPDQPGAQPIAIKIDPGANTTGKALVRLSGSVPVVLHLAELTHRGSSIKESLDRRRALRNNRRARKTRYRAARFLNRTRPKGWLPPSLQSRVDNVMSWVGRYRRWAPISSVVMETVRFDTQKIINPEISGAQYQQGKLEGYELREYLLEKWGHKCAYCDKEHVPLQIEHIVPKGRRGTDRVSNLTLACEACNLAKADRSVTEFLSDKPQKLAAILAQAQQPLAAAAAVNATRTNILGEVLKTGLPVEVSSGGKTKFNRARLRIPKTHALDAACTGETPALRGWNMAALAIKACGRGSYKRTRLSAHGFPKGYLRRQKRAKGFQTGDIVRASLERGKKAGVHVGRVAIRVGGSFNIQTSRGTIEGIGYKYCRLIQRADGYNYS
jgi:5-methylcytosine-specific restriction endonuclease McrA